MLPLAPKTELIEKEKKVKSNKYMYRKNESLKEHMTFQLSLATQPPPQPKYSGQSKFSFQ